MTATPAAQPAENVGRGALVALLAIPIGMLAFGIIGGFGYFLFVIPVAIPYISAWLYAKGAGAPLSRAGWGPWIGVTVAALLLSVATGVLATAFTATGSNLARFLPVLGTTLRYQLGANGLWVLLGIVLGVVGIIGVLRGPRNAAKQAATIAAADARANVTAPPAAPAATTPVTPATTTSVPPASTTAPPVPNAPSPGVVLNGEPVDPDKRP